MKDAEKARRGFLIDGHPADLAEFDDAVRLVVAEVRQSERPDPRSTRPARAVPGAGPRGRARLVELRETIDRAREQGIGRGRALFRGRARQPSGRRVPRPDRSDRGPRRPAILDARIAERRSSIRRAFTTFSVASTLALILIGSLYLLLRRYLAERTASELAIRESEARVRLLLDSAGEGVYGVDVQGDCTFCNPACLQLLGFDSAEQVLGWNMHELVHHTQAGRLALPGRGLPDLPDLPDRRGDAGRGGRLLEGRRLADPGRVPGPPDPPRRRDPGRRGDLRRHRPQAAGRDRDEAPRPGPEGDRPGDLHHRPRPTSTSRSSTSTPPSSG